MFDKTLGNPGRHVPTAALVDPILDHHPLLPYRIVAPAALPSFPFFLSPSFTSLVKNANFLWSPSWEADLDDSMMNEVLALRLTAPHGSRQ